MPSQFIWTSLWLTASFITFELNANAEKHGATFVKVGTMVEGLTYGHIHLNIKLTDLEDRIGYYANISQTLLEIYQIENLTAPAKSRIDWLLQWSEDRKDAVHQKIKAISTTFNAHPFESLQSRVRQPRQILLATGSLIAGGFIGSLITDFKMQTLLSVIGQKQSVLQTQIEQNMIHASRNAVDVKRLKKAMNMLWNELGRVSYLQKEINMEVIVMYLSWALDHNLMSIDNVLDGIMAAHNGRFHPSLVIMSGLTDALERLRQKALKDQREIGLSSPTEAFQMPCSYVYDRDLKLVHIILHIPLYHIGRNLNIFRYIPTPVEISTDTDGFSLVVDFDPPASFLAVSEDDAFYKELTVTELDSCLKLRHTYFCEDNSLAKVHRPSCLYSLFKNNINHVRQHCPTVISRNASRISRLNATTYLMVETRDTTAMLNCQNGISDSFHFTGIRYVHLEKGCTLLTDNFVVKRPHFEPDVYIDNIIVNTPLNMSVLPNIHLHEPTTRELIHETLEQVGKPIPLANIEGLVQFHRRLTRLEHLGVIDGLHITAWTLVWMVIIAAISVLWYHVRRWARGRPPGMDSVDPLVVTDETHFHEEAEPRQSTPTRLHAIEPPVIYHVRPPTTFSFGDTQSAASSPPGGCSDAL